MNKKITQFFLMQRRWRNTSVHAFRCMGIALTVFLLTYASGVQAQSSHVLNGRVTDQQNEPLAGATVMIKNSTQGTQTDIDGNFMLEIPTSESIIVITYQGYFPIETLAGNDRERSFVMEFDEEQSKLEEVVVVGFGTQKKVTMTGSVASVSVKALEQSTAPSLSNALAGRMPGIITRQTSGEPGYDQAQVYMRGMGTW